ncbi:MAG: TlpA family protein disulfide reductase [Candidatus Methylopumilus sp.]
MKLALKLVLLMSLWLTQPLCAQPLKPFVANSRLAIEQAHQGQPMILAFWSIDCSYCLDELNLLGDLLKQHPNIQLVLVNVDGLSTAQDLAKALKPIRLPAAYEAWQFSEPDEERLRYSVDKRWYGELPRTYYYDNTHQVKAVSGSVDLIWLKNWASKF